MKLERATYIVMQMGQGSSASERDAKKKMKSDEAMVHHITSRTLSALESGKVVTFKIYPTSRGAADLGVAEVPS